MSGSCDKLRSLLGSLGFSPDEEREIIRDCLHKAELFDTTVLEQVERFKETYEHINIKWECEPQEEETMSVAQRAIEAVQWALAEYRCGSDSLWGYRVACHPDTKARLDEEWLDLSKEAFRCDSRRRRVESVMGVRIVGSEVVPPRNFLVVRPETLKAMEAVEALMRQARSTK